MFIRLLLIFVLALNLNAGIFGKTVKKKSVFSSTTSSLLKKVHKNSLTYKGETHVYEIRNKDIIYKIGESARGKNKKGESIRAEQQVKKLRQESGDSSWKSKIRKEFATKQEARNYEKELIERTRSRYGEDKNDKSILPGNKTNR